MTPLLRQRYDLPVERGAVIVGLTPGSPAARAGLPVGGAIVAVDRQPIASHSDLLTLLRDYRAGDQVELSFYEGRQLVRMQLTLAEPPAQPRAAQFDDDADPTPPPAAPPEDAPKPEADLRIVPLVPGDRPVGRLLNRVLEGVQQIEQVPPRGANTLVPPPPEEPLVLGPQELQRRVLQLEEYVERLERRVAELEARLDP